jgi:hypothetical protein
MSRRVRKLTPRALKVMIKEEAKKIQLETSDPIAAGLDDVEKVSAKETDAKDLADSLEKDIDYLNVLKIYEIKLVKKLNRLREAKKLLRSRITKKV